MQEDEYVLMLYSLEDGDRALPYGAQMSVIGHDIDIEIDTGAGGNSVSQDVCTSQLQGTNKEAGAACG